MRRDLAAAQLGRGRQPGLPAEVGGVFDAPFDPQRAATGFTIVHYLGDWHALRELILPDLRLELGFVGLALLVGAVAAAVVARRGPQARAIAFLVLGALLLAAIYPYLPFTALGPEGDPALTESNVRYVLPALMLAAMPAAWLIGRAGGRGHILELVLAIAALGALHRAWTGFGSAVDAVALLVALAVVAAPLLVLRKLVPAAAVAGVVAVAPLAGLVLERRAPLGYAQSSPIFAAIEHAGGGLRVGIAGTPGLDTPPFLPAFGPRLRNEVEYVGPIRKHWLERYGRADEFTAALRRGDYDLLLVWNGGGRPAPELAWARAAGYSVIARTGAKTLLRRG